MIDFNQRIFVGLTFTSVRRKKAHWKKQLKEIKRLGIKKIALFPETYNFKQRKEVYKELEKSCVQGIKLVHLRDQDFTEEEMAYFYKKYHTRVFNCHEQSFDHLYRKFPRFRKYIALELNYDNKIENHLEPSKMAGFCIDLSHLKAAKDRKKVEYDYALKHLKNTKFPANHLNGYSHKRRCDLHFITNKHQFDYLQDLPKEVFGKVIALELENSIKEQLEFKKYIVKLLNKKFNH